MSAAVLEYIRGICAHTEQRHIVFDTQEQIVWAQPSLASDASLRTFLSDDVYAQIQRIVAELEPGQSELIHGVAKGHVIRRLDDLIWVEELPMSNIQVMPPLRRRLMLGQLLGDFAHSISNPLAVIQGRLELANLRAKDAAQKKLFMMLYGQVLRISGQLQTIQAISTQRAQTSHERTLKNWFDEFFLLEHRKTLNIHLDIPSLLTANIDEHFFELIFENLLNRCRAVMTPNTPIQIRAQELSQQIQVLIEYTGTPPTKNDILAIEAAMKQQSLPHRGVGFQILCVLILIQSCELQFMVEATERGGRFAIQIPIQGSQAQMASDLQLGPTLQILLIDDNAELAGALRDFLMHEGHSVRQVNSAEDAMNHLHEDWDCIILDLQLPKLSGEELFAHMTKYHPRLTSKVVCISGNPPKNPALQKRYLSKPFTLSQLIAAIFAPQ